MKCLGKVCFCLSSKVVLEVNCSFLGLLLDFFIIMDFSF